MPNNAEMLEKHITLSTCRMILRILEKECHGLDEAVDRVKEIIEKLEAGPPKKTQSPKK